MSGWLPPGCTDRDVDDAAPQNEPEDETEAEARLILVEQIETFAESDLHTLIELNEFERVARLIERLQEKLPKRIT
jgi:hypothetical protein